jgi:hypothetical protein
MKKSENLWSLRCGQRLPSCLCSVADCSLLVTFKAGQVKEAGRSQERRANSKDTRGTPRLRSHTVHRLSAHDRSPRQDRVDDSKVFI